MKTIQTGTVLVRGIILKRYYYVSGNNLQRIPVKPIAKYPNREENDVKDMLEYMVFNRMIELRRSNPISKLLQKLRKTQ